ncbi:ATP-binding protein [Leeia oryzae]|uniref:ATP-binding protein n=1 Tax=Leeia oryzae TaxID=356662 RepID=UPI000363DB89|nr:ATP-binding protein [Leeia oryzae]
MRAPNSLRKQLVKNTLLAILALWLGTAAVTVYSARHESLELLDNKLEQTANTLLAFNVESLIRNEKLPSEETSPMAEAEHFPTSKSELQVQVWRRNGTLIVATPHAPALPFDAQDGFSTKHIHGTHWRTYSVWDEDGTLEVRVIENEANNLKVVGEIVSRQWLAFLLLAPFLALAIWWSVGRGLRPLKRLTQELSARHAKHLEPVPMTLAPEEVKPLLLELNDLLERLNHAFTQERRFTADAAHELRTPLAALRVQAELASQASDPQARAHALAQLVDGAARTTHLLEQLLWLARLDHGQTLENAAQIDLVQLAQQTLANEAGRALAHNQNLELLTDHPVRVKGDAALLGLLLRNLVDNALRYTQEGGSCMVRCDEDDTAVHLIVEDDGPGIPEADMSRVMDRFYRIPGTGKEGSGLGLSLVAEIVRLHGGTMQLSQGQNQCGLRVTVHLPK